LEVKLIYQVDLAKRLELLWQPAHMKFRNVAKVTPAQIEDAYQIVVNKEARPGFMAKQLLEQEPWKNHIESTYKASIKTSNALFDQRYLELENLRETHQLWVDATQAGDQALLTSLQSELKQLAEKLVIDERKVFTQSSAFEDLYHAELTAVATNKAKTLEQITQGILDKKLLEVIEEE
ncbi:NEL-type E3 ubiquitin ligase domain-containing protein, partial [Pseudomonas lundensis]